jgi:hypothetical protein
MTIELLIIAALAVYRITLLINKEAGPWDLLGRFRTWAGIDYDEHSNPFSTGELSAAILCPYCLSVWIGFMVTLYIVVMHVLNLGHITIYPLLPFALSGISAYWFKSAGT